MSFKGVSKLKPNLVRDIIERAHSAREQKSSRSERLGVEARPTLKRVRANMKLTEATMIISSVCVHPFERFERALKSVSDEIRLKLDRAPYTIVLNLSRSKVIY